MRIIFLLLFITTLLAAAPQQTLSGTWYTLNGTYLMRLQLYKNGNYLLSLDKKEIVKGQWEHAGKKQINVKTQRGLIETYRYTFKKGFLIMAKSKDVYMVLGRNRAVFAAMLQQKTAKKAEIKTQSPGKALTQKQVIHLLQNYQKMAPDTVYQHITHLSKKTTTTLRIYEALQSAMIFRACQGKLAYKLPQDRKMCAQAKQSYQNTIKFTNKPWGYANSQRDQMLIGLKCSMGLIDQKSCGTYTKTMKKVNQGQHNTMMEILKADECTKHYTHDHQYLGCW